MRHHLKETIVPASPEALWNAITNIHAWPQWDSGIERTEHSGALTAGSPFLLKPRGGPAVKMTVERLDAPRLFVDLAHLPLAKMRTGHEFLPAPNGTRIRMTIEVSGPLGFLWDRLVARPQMAEFETQSLAFAAFAERATK